jgi:hypothetical protein
MGQLLCGTKEMQVAPFAHAVLGGGSGVGVCFRDTRPGSKTIFSRPEALNASGSTPACRLAISGNARSLTAARNRPPHRGCHCRETGPLRERGRFPRRPALLSRE